jgi:hypothetical protein
VNTVSPLSKKTDLEAHIATLTHFGATKGRAGLSLLHPLYSLTDSATKWISVEFLSSTYR